MLHIPINNSFEIKPWDACIYSIFLHGLYPTKNALKRRAYNMRLCFFCNIIPNVE